jgi:hypothetical protein
LIERLPKRHWFSFGAGVSIAYVFVDVLPILAAGQATVGALDNRHLSSFEYPVFLMALFGLGAFYSLELAARSSRAGNLERSKKDCTSPAVFWVHVGSFALYNAQLGYLLFETEHDGLVACALLFSALILHFIINDHALQSHHKSLYDRYGRWILAIAVIGGYLSGTVYRLEEEYVAWLWAFLAGGLILNTMKDELPQYGDASLISFLAGMTGFALLLVLIAH